MIASVPQFVKRAQDEMGIDVNGRIPAMLMNFPNQLRDVLAVRPRQTDAEWQSRPAAVLAPLYFHEGEWWLLFTRRTDHLKTHSGQVSFPGGAIDPEDDGPIGAALREAEEEIGLRRGDVQVIGVLDELLTVTQYRVTPVVGVIPYPYLFTLNAHETAAVFGRPLRWLADPANRETQQRQSPFTGQMVEVYFYQPWGGHVIWGATAWMVMRLLALLERHQLYPYQNGSGPD